MVRADSSTGAESGSSSWIGIGPVDPSRDLGRKIREHLERTHALSLLEGLGVALEQVLERLVHGDVPIGGRRLRGRLDRPPRRGEVRDRARAGRHQGARLHLERLDLPLHRLERGVVEVERAVWWRRALGGDLRLGAGGRAHARHRRLLADGLTRAVADQLAPRGVPELVARSQPAADVVGSDLGARGGDQPERVPGGPPVGEASRRRGAQELAQDELHLDGIAVADDVARAGHLSLGDAGIGVVQGGLVEQAVRRGHLEQQHAQREDVRLWTERLRAHVLGRAIRHATGRLGALAVRVSCGIDQTDRTVVANDHVMRDQVAVHLAGEQDELTRDPHADREREVVIDRLLGTDHVLEDGREALADDQRTGRQRRQPHACERLGGDADD